MEAGISAYFGLLSLQEHLGAAVGQPTFFKKIEWAVIYIGR